MYEDEISIASAKQLMGSLSSVVKNYSHTRKLVNHLLEQESKGLSGEIFDEYFPFVRTSKNIGELETVVKQLSKGVPKRKRELLVDIAKRFRERPPTTNPNRVIPHQQLLLKYVETEQFEKINPVLNQMLALEPGDVFVWVFRALLFQGLKYSDNYSEYLERQSKPRFGLVKRFKDFAISQRHYHAIINSWNTVLALVALQPEEYSLDSICESSKPVFELRDKAGRFNGAVLIKSLGSFDHTDVLENITEDLDDFVVGLDYLSLIKKITEDHPNFRLPTVVHFTQDPEFGFLYIMIRSQGETLQDRILANADTLEEDLINVANYSALQHVNIPLDMSRRGQIDVQSKVKKCLSNEDLTTNTEIVETVLSNYMPITNSFHHENLVANRDIHAEQFVLYEDEITSLDWEDKGVVPIVFELANLLEYVGNISDQLKYRVIDAYIDSFNQYSEKDIITDREHFKLAYWNAVIQRAISLCSAWSSPERLSMHRRRREVINNALHAIYRIKEEYPEYYSKGEFRSNYLNIYCALRQLREETKDPLDELAHTFEIFGRKLRETEESIRGG